jgi:hypothetical protein
MNMTILCSLLLILQVLPKSDPVVTKIPLTVITEDLCPQQCTCIQDQTALTVDCQGSINEDNSTVNSITLAQEINKLLATIKNLQYLSIVNSWLAEVPSEICNQKSLTILKLNNNQLKRLRDNCLGQLKNLSSLSAECNHIARLQDDLFNGLSHLSTVSFRQNIIESIGKNLFTNYSDLPNLKNIDLSSNLISTIGSWPFQRALAFPGLNVQLGYNKITTFTNAANWKYRCKDPIVNLTLWLNDNMITHLSQIADAYFEKFQDVICYFRPMNRRNGLNFEYNPFTCDCLDFKAYALSYTYPRALTFEAYCGGESPASVFGMKLATVPVNQLVFSVSTNCPNNCSCINQPSNETFHVLCSGAGLIDIPDEVSPRNIPKSLLMPTKLPRYKLDFSHNNVGILKSKLYFSNAVSIDVSSSSLKEITNEALIAMQHMGTIRLHNNSLTTLPPLVAKLNFSFRTISIYQNLWSCKCDQVWLKTWLNSIYNKLENPESIQCDSPSRLKGMAMLTIEDVDFCTDPTTKLLSTVLPSVIVATFLVSLIGILFVLRFRIPIYKRFQFHPFDRDECGKDDMEYDIFLSFAHADTAFSREVLQFFESNSYKVCYHQRDFVPGNSISENIVSAIHSSKRTLCLVSTNFIRSGYCLQEFSIAQNHNVEIKRERLIILMNPVEFDSRIVEEVNIINDVEKSESLRSSNNSLIMLKEFISNHTYIDLNSADWKDRLLYAMPINKLGINTPPGQNFGDDDPLNFNEHFSHVDQILLEA